MALPHIFGPLAGQIPLSFLDDNFSYATTGWYYNAVTHKFVIADLSGIGTRSVVVASDGTFGASSTPYSPLEFIAMAISDETTPIVIGTDKLKFRMPYGFVLSSVKASLSTTSSSGDPTFDIKKNGVSIFSVLLSIDSGDTTSVGAAVPYVLSTSTFADDDEITIDITVAGTGATGVKVYLIGTQS